MNRSVKRSQKSSNLGVFVFSSSHNYNQDSYKFRPDNLINQKVASKMLPYEHLCQQAASAYLGLLV